MRHFYRFPDFAAKAGEFVSLRTCEGTNATVNNAGKPTIHRFYWNVDSAVWNDKADAAVLIEISATEAIRTRPAGERA